MTGQGASAARDEIDGMADTPKEEAKIVECLQCLIGNQISMVPRPLVASKLSPYRSKSGASATS
jgi:hypothetical protein